MKGGYQPKDSEVPPSCHLVGWHKGLGGNTCFLPASHPAHTGSLAEMKKTLGLLAKPVETLYPPRSCSVDTGPLGGPREPL